MPSEYKVYIYTNRDLSLHLAKNFYKNTTIFTDIREISWLDILLRKVRFLSIPPPVRSILTPQIPIKRKLIKVLNLLVNKDLMLQSIKDIIFTDHGQNVLFVPYHHAWEIYSLHCPQMKVIEIDKNLSPKLIASVYQEARRSLFRDFSTGTTVFINPTSLTLLKAYKLIHPNKRIVIRYHDMISWQLDKSCYSGTKDLITMVKRLKQEGIIDQVESYCHYDANLLDAIYRPNGANPHFLKKIDKDFRTNIYNFLGGKSSNKKIYARIIPLNTIQTELMQIYPTIKNWTGADIAKFSKNWLSYEEFLNKTVLSEICVDLLREEPNEGFSFRIAEALNLNRKIISNRISLTEEPFYSPERIFLIGIDSPVRLKEFLEKELSPLPKSIVNHYNSTLWWTDEDPFQRN